MLDRPISSIMWKYTSGKIMILVPIDNDKSNKEKQVNNIITNLAQAKKEAKNWTLKTLWSFEC